jgi:hypothetical protein
VPSDYQYNELQDSDLRNEINAAIRKGLDDVEAGRVQPAEKVMKEIRQQFGFSKELFSMSKSAMMRQRILRRPS